MKARVPGKRMTRFNRAILSVGSALGIKPVGRKWIEAFAALKAGATALKLFPAEASSPAVLRAMCAVLPAQTRILPVGGIDGRTISVWRKAGAAGFGLGSSVYRAGHSPGAVLTHARDIIKAWSAE